LHPIFVLIGKVCDQLKHYGKTNSDDDDTTLGGLFQRNLNQSFKYSASSCFNAEKIPGTGHPERLSTFEFDTDVIVTTPVHSFDTSDREMTQRSSIRLLDSM
jgi:hypothetical protein